MANRFYGLNQGEVDKDVTEAAATTSKQIEVTVALGANLSRDDVFKALELIRDYILKGNWEPA